MAAIFGIAFLAALVGIFKPYINGSKRWHFGVGAFAAFVLIGVFADPSEKSDNAPTSTPEASTLAGAASGEPIPDAAKNVEQPQGEWNYQTDRDEMRGAESHYAQLDAINTLDLDFPYGEQRGSIIVRQSATFGFDILVGVPSGQIMCSSYRNSYINVKFDDGPIQRFGCNDASDGTSNMVFIEGAKGFLSKLKKSKKAIIEAEFYQNGMQQMTFNTANLVWED